MNKVNLIGRLTKDPELKFTPGDGKAVTTLTLAVDRRYPGKDGKREADFIPCVIWGKQAETVANRSAKGKLLGISGRIQIRSYENKEGRKVYVTEIISEEAQIIEWANGEQTSQTSQTGQTNNNEFYDPDLTPVDDGDIPF